MIALEEQMEAEFAELIHELELRLKITYRIVSSYPQDESG